MAIPAALEPVRLLVRYNRNRGGAKSGEEEEEDKVG